MRVAHGQVWSVMLDPTVANGQRGTLPIRQAIVVPVTTRERGFPHHIAITDQLVLWLGQA